MIENLFVCIGAQKAGTTWLHHSLSKDPCFAKCQYVKEVHYFDFVHKQSSHLNNWRAHHFLRAARSYPVRAGINLASMMDRGITRDLTLSSPPRAIPGEELFRQFLCVPDDAWYCELLRPGPNQDWSVDITPDYAVIGAAGFLHMSKLARNLRILFILRDPIERAWSGLLQGYKRKPGGIEGFAAGELRESAAVIAACTVGGDVGARSDYEATLDALSEAGLSDSVLIKFYDEIAVEPEKFIKDVYRHLGKNFDPASTALHQPLDEKVHVTEGKIEMPENIREALRAFYLPKIERLARRLPVPGSWGN